LGTRRLGVTPYRLAGRSLRPSRLRLTQVCLRCAIHGSAGHIRRLNGRGNPEPPQLEREASGESANASRTRAAAA